MAKKDWFWVVNGLKRPLLLIDNTTPLKDGEYFHVAWDEKETEKKTPKQVPNNILFAGHLRLGNIVAVDAPRETAKSKGGAT